MQEVVRVRELRERARARASSTTRSHHSDAIGERTLAEANPRVAERKRKPMTRGRLGVEAVRDSQPAREPTESVGVAALLLAHTSVLHADSRQRVRVAACKRPRMAVRIARLRIVPGRAGARRRATPRRGSPLRVEARGRPSPRRSRGGRTRPRRRSRTSTARALPRRASRAMLRRSARRARSAVTTSLRRPRRSSRAELRRRARAAHDGAGRRALRTPRRGSGRVGSGTRPRSCGSRSTNSARRSHDSRVERRLRVAREHGRDELARRSSRRAPRPSAGARGRRARGCRCASRRGSSTLSGIASASCPDSRVAATSSRTKSGFPPARSVIASSSSGAISVSAAETARSLRRRLPEVGRAAASSRGRAARPRRRRSRRRSVGASRRRATASSARAHRGGEEDRTTLRPSSACPRRGQRRRGQERRQQVLDDAVQPRAAERRLQLVDLGRRDHRRVEHVAEQRRPRHEIRREWPDLVGDPHRVRLRRLADLDVEQRSQQSGRTRSTAWSTRTARRRWRRPAARRRGRRAPRRCGTCRCPQARRARRSCRSPSSPARAPRRAPASRAGGRRAGACARAPSAGRRRRRPTPPRRAWPFP